MHSLSHVPYPKYSTMDQVMEDLGRFFVNLERNSCGTWRCYPFNNRRPIEVCLISEPFFHTKYTRETGCVLSEEGTNAIFPKNVLPVEGNPIRSRALKLQANEVRALFNFELYIDGCPTEDLKERIVHRVKECIKRDHAEDLRIRTRNAHIDRDTDSLIRLFLYIVAVLGISGWIVSKI